MVLVEPKSAGLLGGNINWNVTKQNKFLLLQHHAMAERTLGFFSKLTGFILFSVWDGKYAKNYRILTNDSQHLIIAVSNSEEHIEQEWDWLNLLLDNFTELIQANLIFEIIPDLMSNILLKQSEVMKNSAQRNNSSFLENSQNETKTEDSQSENNNNNDNAAPLSPYPALKGWLWKAPPSMISKWQKRWFVQKGNHLYYSESPSHPEPLGSIELHSIEQVESSKDATFIVKTHERELYLCAESVQEKERWMKELIRNSKRELSNCDIIGRRSKDLAGLELESYDPSTDDPRFQIYLLHNNKFTECPSLTSLKMLTELTLTNNSIACFPDHLLSENVNLEELYLGNNHITEVPETISKLTKLRILMLSKNRLKSVPVSLGNMKNLKFLFLNNNNLTAVPTFLKSAHLSILTLYDNPLQHLAATTYTIHAHKLL